MHKILLIILAFIPLLWSCGGKSEEAADTSDTITEKTALDSLSYLEGRFSGLSANLGVENALTQLPDSIKSFYDKKQMVIGFESAMMTDTTTTNLYSVVNIAQMFLTYNFNANAKYAPIDYDIFSAEFSKVLMSDDADLEKLKNKGVEANNMIELLSKGTPAQLEGKSQEFTMLMADIAGLNFAYQIMTINNTPDAQKINKNDVLKAVEYYIGLRPRSVGFQMGFVTGLNCLYEITSYRMHNVDINISDYADAFVAAFNESGVTNESIDKVREQLSELLNRQLKNLADQTSN